MRDIETRDEHGRLHGHAIWYTVSACTKNYRACYDPTCYDPKQYMYFRGQFYHGQDAGYTEYHHQTLKQVEYIII